MTIKRDPFVVKQSEPEEETEINLDDVIDAIEDANGEAQDAADNAGNN